MSEDDTPRTYYNELEARYVFYTHEHADSHDPDHDCPPYQLFERMYEREYPLVSYSGELTWVNSNNREWTSVDPVAPTPQFYNVLCTCLETGEVGQPFTEVLPSYEYSAIGAVLSAIDENGYSEELEQLVWYAQRVGTELLGEHRRELEDWSAKI